MADVKPLKIGTAPVAVEEFGSGDTIPAASVSGLGTMATQAAADYVTLATAQNITGLKRFSSGVGGNFSASFEGVSGTQIVALGSVSGVPTINAYTAGFAAPTTLQLQNHGGALNIGGNTTVFGAVSASTNVSAGGAVSVAGNIHGGNSTFATSFNAGSSRLSHLPGWPVSVRQEFGTDGTGWQYRIATNNSGTVVDRVTVTDGGNVLIGTTTDNGNKLQVTGAITATTTVEAGTSLLVTDVYQLTAVSTAFQTRTFDFADGAVQTIQISESFTLNVSGPAGKAGQCELHIYNSAGSSCDMTRGTGWHASALNLGTASASTRCLFLRWDGFRMYLEGSALSTGDTRPT